MLLPLIQGVRMRRERKESAWKIMNVRIMKGKVRNKRKGKK